MLGGLFGYVTAEISAKLRKLALVNGLYGAAAFMLLCAAGYALHGFHVYLSMRYGPLAASLWIAGGLALLAIVAAVAAAVISRQKPPPRPLAKTAMVAAPIAVQMLGTGMRGRKPWRFAALAGVAVLGVVLGRQMLRSDEGEADDPDS